MKKVAVLLVSLVFVLGLAGIAVADDVLKAGEKKVRTEEFEKVIPKDRVIGVEEFAKRYQEVMAGKRKAYLIDVRTHPEFYAGHIPGTDHISSGHMYIIPKKITDPDAEIYVFCRTSKRAAYVAGILIKYGYKNVWMYDGGVVGWMKSGRELCNQYMGKFKVTEYHKQFTGPDKDPFRVRNFHPY